MQRRTYPGLRRGTNSRRRRMASQGPSRRRTTLSRRRMANQGRSSHSVQHSQQSLKSQQAQLKAQQARLDQKAALVAQREQRKEAREFKTLDAVLKRKIKQQEELKKRSEQMVLH